MIDKSSLLKSQGGLHLEFIPKDGLLVGVTFEADLHTPGKVRNTVRIHNSGDTFFVVDHPELT